MFALIGCLIVTSAVAGPAKKPDAAKVSTKAAQTDPVAEFKALVASASEPKEWSRVSRNSKFGKWAKQYYSLGQVKFDVKKTDSLVSPAMGIVSFPIEVRQSEFFDTEQEAAQSTELSKLRATFFYSGQYLLNDGAWQVDQFSYYAALGDRAPDRTTVKLSRDELLRDLKSGADEAPLIGKWLR